MRRFASPPSILPVAALAIGIGLAAAPAPGVPPQGPPARQRVEKVLEGRVTEHTAGQALSVATDDGREVTFRLDERDCETRVAGGLDVGTRVRVVEARAVDGRRSLSISRAPEPRPRR
ncbi:MAG: hypothetical protein KJ062_02625 [Thermoanaerobaculia bacterium]|nr:hypothetical protein [Thermoanaerobaculia bacterium]